MGHGPGGRPNVADGSNPEIILSAAEVQSSPKSWHYQTHRTGHELGQGDPSCV